MSFRVDRFEMKFLITRQQREKLMPHLQPHLRADENAGEGAFYPIVSLYYDNAARDCYWEKIRGERSRRKLRVRVYGSLDGDLPPTSFVEIKHKCEGRGVKRRVRMPLEEALVVASGKETRFPLRLIDRKIVEEVHQLVHLRGFQPCCCMRYDRQAFADRDPESDLRITFDTGIAFRFDNLTPVPDDRNFNMFLHSDDQAVMEVKVTGSVPYWLTRMLGEHGCILRSHSKYCNALEMGDPVLRKMLYGGPKRINMPAVLDPIATSVDVTNHGGANNVRALA